MWVTPSGGIEDVGREAYQRAIEGGAKTHKEILAFLRQEYHPRLPLLSMPRHKYAMPQSFSERYGQAAGAIEYDDETKAYLESLKRRKIRVISKRSPSGLSLPVTGEGVPTMFSREDYVAPSLEGIEDIGGQAEARAMEDYKLAAHSVAPSYGAPDTTVDEELAEWRRGRLASTVMPGAGMTAGTRAALSPLRPRRKRARRPNPGWLIRLRAEEHERWLQSKQGQLFTSEMDPDYEGPADYKMANVWRPGSGKEMGPVEASPHTGRWDETEYDRLFGAYSVEDVEAKRTDTETEVLHLNPEQELEAFVLESQRRRVELEKAERIFERTQVNALLGYQNENKYLEEQGKHQELMQIAGLGNKGKQSLERFFSNISAYHRKLDVVAANENPFFRDVLGLPPIEVPDVPNPFSRANLDPVLRSLAGAGDEGRNFVKSLADWEKLYEVKRSGLAGEEGDEAIAKQFASLSGRGKAGVTDFLVEGARQAELADEAWSALPESEKRRIKAKDIRMFEALSKKVASARQLVSAVSQKARQPHLDEFEKVITQGDLKEQQLQLNAATRELNKFLRQRQPARAFFKEFRRAVNPKADLTRHKIDWQTGDPMYDEEGLPVLEEQDYIMGAVVETATAVRREARRMQTDLREQEIEKRLAELDQEEFDEVISLGMKPTGRDARLWKRDSEENSARRRERMKLKDERNEINLNKRLKADRKKFIGGFISAFEMLGSGAVSLGKGLASEAMSIGRSVATGAQESWSGLSAADDILRAGARASAYSSKSLGTAYARGLSYVDDPIAGAASLAMGKIAPDPEDIWAEQGGIVPGYIPFSASGGPISARQMAPGHASGKLPPLAAHPGAYLVGERGPERFITAASRGAMVGQYGPEVIVPGQSGVIAPNHWDGDPEQIPGLHAGGPIRYRGVDITPPGGGIGPHAHANNMRMYGYYDKDGRFRWADLGVPQVTDPLTGVSDFQTPPLTAIRNQGTRGVLPVPGFPGLRPFVRRPMRIHGGPIPQNAQGGPQAPLTGPRQGMRLGAYAPSPIGTRGAPAVAQPIKQQAYIDAQDQVRDLMQRIESVRIQASDALQLTPVRALSVSLGQQFQERFGGRQQIRMRESIARQRANEAGRVATRLAAQTALAEERDQQAREIALRNQIIVRRGGTLTPENRDQMRLAVLQKREARSGADVLRPEAERLAIRAEILQKGERNLIREVRQREASTGRPETVFMGRERRLGPRGEIVENEIRARRELIIRQQAAQMRMPVSQGGEGADTGGILQRGNVVRAQGMGLVGIVGGTMLFTRAVKASAMAFEMLNQALDPLLDAWTNFTSTTNSVADELGARIQQGGRGGGPETAAYLASIGQSFSSPALERRGLLIAASRNMSAIQANMRAEGNLAGRVNAEGVTTGLNNGPLAGTPIIGGAIGWIGQEQSIAERIVGTVGTRLEAGKAKELRLAPDFVIPQGITDLWSNVMNRNPSGPQSNEWNPGGQGTMGSVLESWVGKNTLIGGGIDLTRDIASELTGAPRESYDYRSDQMTTQKEADAAEAEAAKRAEQIWGEGGLLNKSLQRTQKNVGEFVFGVENMEDAVKATADALRKMPGGDPVADLVERFDIAFLDRNGTVPKLMEDALGNISSGVIDAFTTASENLGRKDFDQLFKTSTADIEAQIRDVQRQAEYARKTTVPLGFYTSTMQQPLMPATYGIQPSFGTSTFGGPLSNTAISGPLAAANAQTLAGLEQAQAQGRGVAVGQLMQAKGYGENANPASILWEEGSAALGEYLADLSEVTRGMAEIESISREIATYQVADSAASMAMAQEQYNEQLYLSRRGLGDVLGIAGKLAGTYKTITKYQEDGSAVTGQQTVQATELGQLQRAQIMDSRQLTSIQLARSQRELNLQLALSKMQAPGQTPQERAVRQHEAELVAREQQAELDINKRTTQRGYRIQDIQISQNARDALKQLSFLESGKALEIRLQGSQAVQENLRRTLTLKESFQGLSLDVATAFDKITLDTQAKIETESSDFRDTFAAETDAIFAEIVKRNKKSYEDFLAGTGGIDDKATWAQGRAPVIAGAGATTANGTTVPQGMVLVQTPGGPVFVKENLVSNGTVPLGDAYEKPRRNATGGIFNPSSAMSFIAGEAGPESVIVIRNPKAGILSNGGGGGGANINVVINNPQVRGQEDIDKLARLVVRKLHDEARTLGVA